MKIYGCRMDHFENPMGYDLPSLRASWKVKESDGTKQTKARLIVCQEGEIIWDSGEAALDSLGTRLPVALAPRTRYTWRVQVWDDADGTAQSDENWFETAKLDEAWQAKWIGYSGDTAPIFRRRFSIDNVPQRARAYGVGLGLYEMRLNGYRVSDEYLLPGCTVYSGRVQYQTFDLLPFLTRGENTLEIRLADGWYMGRFGLAGKSNNYGDRHALLMEIHLDDTVIGTDEAWQAAASDVTARSLYDGECWQPGRQMTWTAARLLADESHPLTARVGTPVRVQRKFPVRELLCTPEGEWVLDFGQNMAGFVSFRCALPAGSEVRLKYAEFMQRGSFYRENLRSAEQAFTYISDGVAREVAPRFTYYGFRYVRVKGMGKPDPKAFTACAVWSDMDETGDIDLHNAPLNRFLENVRWGQRSNYVDVPTDCPQRDERMGWTADTQIFTDTACYLTDACAFLSKFMGDVWLEQQARGGGVPNVVPAFGEKGICSAWGDAATIIPWTLYLHYGDRDLLARQYPGMKAWVEYVRGIDRDTGDTRLWTTGFHFGDWLGLDNEANDGFKGGTDDGYIASAYYLHSARLTAQAAAILGQDADARRYAALAREILAAIQNEYFTKTGRPAITTQCGYVLALKMGLCPQGTIDRCVRALADKLTAANVHLRTGFVGTAYLYDVLMRYGLQDMATTLLLNEDYPSWLYAVKLGATTVWERWDSVLPNGDFNERSMNSLNHYSYGSVAASLYGDLAGLRPCADAPGFRRAEITPRPNRRLPHVDMSFDSPVGMYKVSYRIAQDGALSLSVEIPFGASASLILPNHEGDALELTAGTHAFCYQPQPPLRPVYGVDSALETLLESAECAEALKNAGVTVESVPDPLRRASIRALNDLPFVSLTDEALSALDAALAAISTGKGIENNVG